MAGLLGHLNQDDRETLEREGGFCKHPEINKIDEAKKVLYKKLLDLSPDIITENESEIMYHLSFEPCIQNILSEAVKSTT